MVHCDTTLRDVTVVRRDGERMTLEVERRAFVAAGAGDRLRDFLP